MFSQLLEKSLVDRATATWMSAASGDWCDREFWIGCMHRVLGDAGIPELSKGRLCNQELLFEA